MRAIFVGILAAALWTSAAQAEPGNTVFLEELTWTELRDAVAAGKTTAIIPAGGTEQSGPLVALGKHNVRVKALAGRIAETLSDALVAPVIAYVPEGSISPPTEHMKFPGTLTITDQTFEDLLVSTGRSLQHAGFKTIALIGDHGGYQQDLQVAADRLNRDFGSSGAHAVAVLSYYRASLGEYTKALLSHGARERDIGTHAALADTSMMLAVDPSMVRSSGLASAGKLGAADGVYGGNPSASSPEFGQLGTELMIKAAVEDIRKASKQPH